MNVWTRMAAGLVVALWAADAAGQTEQGRISGTVSDQSRAFVAGASITARNERTGEVRSAVSNDRGYFFIGSLKPSNYTIKTEKAGFAVIEYTAMLFSPRSSTTMRATPDGVPDTRRTSSTAMPSATSASSVSSPNASSPRQAIRATEPPARAAATA